MDLTLIREALATTLGEIPGVRAVDTIPEPVPVGNYDLLVVQPDNGTYIEYSEVSGLVNQNWVHMLVTAVTLNNEPRTAQNRIDQLLSCGADQPRSIRTKLATNISAGGQACQVVVETASIRQIELEGNPRRYLAADIQLKIMARC